MGRAGQQGRWAVRAGLTSGSAAVATTTPRSTAEAASHPRPQGRDGGERRSQGQRGSDGSGRVGPAASGSERAAAAHPPPCQRDSARPGQAHPPPHPAQRARVATPPQPLSPPLPGLPMSLRLLNSQQPPPTAAGPLLCSSPRAFDPAHAAPPRTTPQLQTSGARAFTSHAPYSLPKSACPPHPAPARDAARECGMRLRGHAPFRPPQAAPPKLFFLTLRQSWKLL